MRKGQRVARSWFKVLGSGTAQRAKCCELQGRNTLSILRIKLKLHFEPNVEPDPRGIGSAPMKWALHFIGQAFHRASAEIG